MITRSVKVIALRFSDKKSPGAKPRRTALKLQTQQADRVAGITDDEEANDDPQRG
ncbi:hypothetical protein MJ561_18595 [Klebsiella pneumoniae]|nr:hypothetical protein MJ561_18595 [Klebsiella pneumoniae]